MRLKKDLVQLVQSNYVPLHEEYEGRLRGGFGLIAVENAAQGVKFNIVCKNPECKNNCDCTPSPTATNTNTNTNSNESKSIGVIGFGY